MIKPTPEQSSALAKAALAVSIATERTQAGCLAELVMPAERNRVAEALRALAGGTSPLADIVAGIEETAE